MRPLLLDKGEWGALGPKSLACQGRVRVWGPVGWPQPLAAAALAALRLAAALGALGKGQGAPSPLYKGGPGGEMYTTHSHDPHVLFSPP
jgi:hypothetical protein